MKYPRSRPGRATVRVCQSTTTMSRTRRVEHQIVEAVVTMDQGERLRVVHLPSEEHFRDGSQSQDIVLRRVHLRIGPRTGRSRFPRDLPGRRPALR